MPALFAITLFLSANLLFMVQPMVGKMVLPLLGGGAGVWNTCMVFFQALLLLGYLYAHKLSSLDSVRQQVLIHLAVLGTTAGVMLAAAGLTADHTTVPIVTSLAPEGTTFPFLQILAILTLAIGLPFFAVSTSAPLLQRWFSATGHSSARDPYFLYAASNAGSLLSLLGYPLVTEPSFRLLTQTWLWTGGFLILIGLTLQCGRAAMNPLLPPAKKGDTPTPAPLVGSISLGRKLKWLGWAFVPSSLMLGVTTHMTTDIASVPLLWVIPLALYLLTFIIAFAKTPQWFRPVLGNFSPVATLILVFVITSGIEGLSVFVQLGLHLGVYFMTALLMHSELARDRPEPRYLTMYFLWMSLGGMLGGMFNAIVAPLLFPHTYEYPLTMVLGAMLVPVLLGDDDRNKTEEEKAKHAARAGTRMMLDSVVPMLLLIALVMINWLAGTATFKSTSSTIARALTDWQRLVNSTMIFSPETVGRFLAFAPPCMVCFLFIDRPLRFGLCVAAIFFMHYYLASKSDSVVMTSRSFYGILRIDQYDDPDSQEYLAPIVKMKQTTDGTESFSTLSSAYRTQTRYNSLMHGTTLHGRQIAQPHLIQVGIDPETNEPVYDDAGILTSFQDDLTLLGVGTGWESVLLGGLRHSWDPTKDPLTYYHRTGPVGDLFRTAIQRTWSREQRLPEVGMVGLGTGSVACYASSGMNLTFYEIDRSVIDLVEKPTRVMNPAEVKAGKPANLGPFTFIEDARKRGAKIDFILGDARLTLERHQKARYDLLLIDAFSSDSIPIHLLTKESVRLYEQRLSDKGLLALHISNRYIQLEPVVAAIARDLGLVVRHFSDSGEQFPGKTSSTWVVLARSEDDLGAPFVPLKNQPVEEMLAGTWRATPNFLSDGKSSRQAFTLATIDGNQVICDLDGSYAPWSLTLRSGAQYLQFELARGAKEYHGILEIERPGEWNLCFTPKTEPIPKNFDSTSPGTVSLNLKKKKSDVSQWTQLEILEQVEAWTDDHADVLRVIRLKELQAIRKMLGLPTPITE